MNVMMFVFCARVRCCYSPIVNVYLLVIGKATKEKLDAIENFSLEDLWRAPAFHHKKSGWLRIMEVGIGIVRRADFSVNG